MPLLILLLAVAFAASPLVTSSFGGFAPDAFPVPQDDPPVQPAGYAFGIWGGIYLALIVHGAVGLRRGGDPAWAPTRAPLAVSLAVGAVWIPVANASPVWATVLIWVMLAGAVAALLRAGRSEGWVLDAPLGLFAGWLTAASSVSIGLLLAGYGITDAVAAAMVALVVATALAAAVLLTRPSPGYLVAVVWALVALIVQNAGGAILVAALAGLAIAFLAALALPGIARRA